MHTVTKSKPTHVTFDNHESRVTPEIDRELEWLFTRAEIEIGTPSNWEPIVEAALCGTEDRASLAADRTEERAEAMHTVRPTIVGWLGEALSGPPGDPRRGVHARRRGLARRAHPPRRRHARRRGTAGSADPLYARALAAYRAVRGTRPCLVEEEP